MSETVSLHICESCSPADLIDLRTAMESAGLGDSVRIVEQGCMNGCARPVSVALQSTGRATYFFSGVNTDTDADDIVATVRSYLVAPDGWIEDARACGRLRFCLVGRVPAL